MMKPLQRFEVQPRLPERLGGLREIAFNLWWTWQPDAIQILRRVDPDVWERVHHNPVLALGSVAQERFRQLEADEGFLAELDRVASSLRDYTTETTWFARTHEAANAPQIAYFSAEYGLTECLTIYSGGLGILSADHLKSASELGVPLVAVGLLYQRGYFQQYLNPDGWQQEYYRENDFHNLPLRLLTNPDGEPIWVRMEFPGRTLLAQIWELLVGRVRLILLDTNVGANSPDDRMITSELYGGDKVRRIQQEIVLGIGGVRALEAIGCRCPVLHLNEGHSAFSTLERMRSHHLDRGMPAGEAMELVRKTTIFTTHTPVPAGIDEFPEPLMREYLNSMAASIGLPWDEFLALGALGMKRGIPVFNMACLALNMSYRANGVSRLHGEVARRMWHEGWPGVPKEEIPIGYITNGAHTRSWISREMRDLFDRYLGPAWVSNPADQTIWQRIDTIPDEELWRTHERRRERLVAFARRHLVTQMERRGALDHEMRTAREVLNTSTLTIGFARRFATYKRATLLFRDGERLRRILSNNETPVQIIIAGKAHPRDNEGKELIRQIVHFASHPDTRRRVVFLEDYDLELGRMLLQGVDLWLNTPRRPMEACGTSGMKAVFNGGLNVSTRDGWWDEAYTREVGWAIGSGEQYPDPGQQDEIESRALYHLLEEEIVPLFYQRSADDLPRGWIAKMKNSMRELGPLFTANRMMREYTEKYYLPALRDARTLADDGGALTGLCRWKAHVREHWGSVAVIRVESNNGARVHVNDPVNICVTVDLGALDPQDVQVQLYAGRLNAHDDIVNASITPLTNPKNVGAGHWEFCGTAAFGGTGRHGFTVRVLPSHQGLTHAFETRLLRWPTGGGY